MTRLVVASQNPVKAQATRRGFRRVFPTESFAVECVAVPSGVSEQPTSDRQAVQGAMTRAHNARAAVPDADYWVGIEGAVSDDGEEMAVFAWVVVQSRSQVGKGRTGAFLLPGPLAQLVRQGMELGPANDRVFGESNSKQGRGAVGVLTRDVIDRAQFLEHAVVLALIPFANTGLYGDELSPRKCRQQSPG